MYICKDCGFVFPEPHYRKETIHHNELDQGVKDEVGYIPICPMCHSEEVEVADQCLLTGEYGDYGRWGLSPVAVEFIGNYISDMSQNASQTYGRPIAECDILDVLSEYLEMGN